MSRSCSTLKTEGTTSKVRVAFLVFLFSALDPRESFRNEELRFRGFEDAEVTRFGAIKSSLEIGANYEMYLD